MKIAEAIDFLVPRNIVHRSSFIRCLSIWTDSQIWHFADEFEPPNGSSSSGLAVLEHIWYKNLFDFQHTFMISAGNCLFCRWQITHLLRPKNSQEESQPVDKCRKLVCTDSRNPLLLLCWQFLYSFTYLFYKMVSPRPK